MKCIKCDSSEYTKCVDDMLMVGYVAEIYECSNCDGTIEVFYEKDTISRKTIKSYRYEKMSNKGSGS